METFEHNCKCKMVPFFLVMLYISKAITEVATESADHSLLNPSEMSFRA